MRYWSTPFAGLLGLALFAVPVSADHTSEQAAPDTPAKVSGAAAKAPPAYNSRGLGGIHHAVSTRSAEAQRLFNQGLALCFAFNHEEAVRSFERALKADSKLAMAHWGIAYALGPNINLATDSVRSARAYAEIQHAQKLASTASSAERDWIAAMATRYAASPMADRVPLELAFRAAMRRLHDRYPADPDAAAIYAESIMDLSPWDYWLPSGAPKPDTEELLAVLEAVLAKHPDHTGANHYYIHAIEASPHPERAAAAAARLAKLAPDAGHLVHMPSHIQHRMGDYVAAAEANIKAARVDSAYVARHQVEGVYPMMYWNHNHDFAAAALMQLGRYQEAMKHAAFTQKNATEMAPMMPMIEAFAARPYEIMVAFRRWDDILASPEPAPVMVTSRLTWRFARGAAHAAKGQLDAARVDLDSLNAGIARLAPDYPMGTNMAVGVMPVSRAQLAARIARAAGDLATAEREARAAVEAFDAIKYDEPEEWLLPARLDLAGVLLARGDAPGAEAVYRDELAKHPNSAFALNGLAAAQRAQGRADDAAATARLLAAAWKGADRPLGIEDL